MRKALGTFETLGRVRLGQSDGHVKEKSQEAVPGAVSPALQSISKAGSEMGSLPPSGRGPPATAFKEGSEVI